MNKKQVTLHENLPVIEVASPLLLDTLLSDKRTAQIILKRLDEGSDLSLDLTPISEMMTNDSHRQAS